MKTRTPCCVASRTPAEALTAVPTHEKNSCGDPHCDCPIDQLGDPRGDCHSDPLGILRAKQRAEPCDEPYAARHANPRSMQGTGGPQRDEVRTDQIARLHANPCTVPCADHIGEMGAVEHRLCSRKNTPDTKGAISKNAFQRMSK